MESQNALGLYFNKNQAVALSVNKGAVAGSVTVTLEPGQDGDVQTLAHRLAEQCKERNFKYTDVSVALDSSLFMQHSVHSEFKNARQIAATVRFDTEEVVASDISNLSVAFEIIDTDDNGASLNVFTAKHDPLSQIILTLQSHALDPIRILPDVGCLTDLIQQNLTVENTALVCLVSRQNGYFLKYNPKTGLHPVRAFLVSSHSNMTDILVREGLTTMASVGGSSSQMFVFSTEGQVDTQVMSQKLGTEVTGLPWFESSPWGQQAQTDHEDSVKYAIAYGAATLSQESGTTLDLRRDFMPYQGKKMRLQSALKWTCISATLLILAWGGRLQAKWFQVKTDRAQLMAKLEEDYVRVMPGKKSVPSNPVRDLERAIRAIKDVQGGRLDLAGSQSTLAKLTLILKAINESYTVTGLEIDRINISLSSITINGSTSSTAGRLQFKSALQAQKISDDVTMQMSTPKDGRAPFNVAIKTKASREDD